MDLAEKYPSERALEYLTPSPGTRERKLGCECPRDVRCPAPTQVCPSFLTRTSQFQSYRSRTNSEQFTNARGRGHTCTGLE